MLRTACTVAVLMTAASTAYAQTNAAPTASTQQPTSQQTAGATHKDMTSLRQQVAANLKQSGFTDVKIVPDSFLVQAKDKSGNPVTMWLNPESFTEIVAVGDTGQGQGLKREAAPGDAFTSPASNDELSSKLIGTNVYNSASKDIGVIKDIAFSPTGVKAYIIDVGGFLGMGGHNVAVRPSAVQLSYDDTAKKWNARMDATADQLKAAPEYKYPNRTAG